MKRIVQSVVTAAALVALAGCSGGAGTEASEPTGESHSGLAKLDVCKIMTPKQLKERGLSFANRVEQFDFEPGCSYDSDFATIRIYKNQQQTVESYKESGNWEQYDPIRVNDRPGARAKVAGSSDDQCSTLISAGGGVIETFAQSADPRTPFDACAESLKIAKQIEPNLPE